MGTIDLNPTGAGPEVEIRVRCDEPGCGETLDVRVARGCDLPHLTANQAAGRVGWRWDGRGRRLCPRCWAASRSRQPGRGGFTLVELLVVLTIVAIVAAVTLPYVSGWRESSRLAAAASLVQGEMVAARERAAAKGASGVRFTPHPAYPIERRADGSIDPDAPLAYSGIVPLEAAPGYSAGRVAVRGPGEGYPPGFVPARGRLVLEQEPLDADGSLLEPTSWAWNVRCGDRVELAGRLYTVCGPVAIAPGDGNPELFVSYDPAWPALDRGDGPAEWLYLTNGLDDDDDGRPDNGWNGIDDDLDGVADGPAEWTEEERWGAGAAGLRRASYTLRRRPAPAPGSTGVRLVDVAIDATGWATPGGGRSRLVVDPWTGAADLMFDASGRVEPIRPTSTPSGVRWHHLWLTAAETVGGDVPAEAGRLVTIDAKTGRAWAGDADPADPAGSRRAMEGGGG